MRPDVYRVARSFGSGRRQHAFDLAWADRPVIRNADEDFGPTEPERAEIIRVLSQSHRVRSGGDVGGRQIETIELSDPRTRDGFDAAVYRLPPPWVLL